MAHKVVDTRRDEFRAYLERNGVFDIFTKVLSKLYTQNKKPEDAIEFIRMNMGDTMHDQDTIQALKKQLNDANDVIDELQAKLNEAEAKAKETRAAVLSITAASPDKSPTPPDPMEVAEPVEGETTTAVPDVVPNEEEIQEATELAK